MSKQQQLKQQILEQSKAYYQLVHQRVNGFKAGDRINYAGRVYDEQELVNLVDASLDFWLTYGDYSAQFEKKLAHLLGIKHALLVNSGSSANLLAFSALTSPLLKERQIKRGDEVITIAAGFPTTIAPIVQYGAVPVFVDIDLSTYNIDVTQLQLALSDRSKAVMIAHSLGNPFDLHSVKSFCDNYNLWLIEDNCDALGATYQDRYTGTIGDIGTSSFYPAHQITMGEGGAVYTNNNKLKRIMLSIRDWGRDCWCDSGVDNSCQKRFAWQLGSLPKGYDHKYIYSHFGYNLKATDMQAAIGVAQLDKLDYFIHKRRENFAILYEGVQTLESYFILPQATTHSQPCWFGFPLTIRDGMALSRNELTTYLERQNIQTRNLFGGNILRHPCFDHLQQHKDYRIIGDLNNSDKIMKDTFWVGLYSALSKEHLQFIIHHIKAYTRDR